MKASEKMPKMKLKCNKTKLYDLIADKHGCYMPKLKHAQYEKGGNSHFLKFDFSENDRIEAHFAVVAGAALLSVEKRTWNEEESRYILKIRVTYKIPIEELEERGMIEHIGIKAVA